MPTQAEITAEAERRVKLFRRLGRDKKARATYLLAWEQDVELFTRDTAWTYDPRNVPLGLPAFMPFVPWPRQVEYLEWITGLVRNGDNGVTEKSRDQGATWLNIYWDLHAWRFSDGYSAGYGSNKLENVDVRDDPDSIFEKARIALRFWPRWLLPKGFIWGRHAKYCLLTNPANGAHISGEGGEQIGRGGRSVRYTLDEHAYIEAAASADKALSNNTTSINYVSTPNGMGNVFASKRHSGKCSVFVMDWKDDPRKDQAWYDKQCEKYSARVVAGEIDRDYGAGGEGVVIPAKWVRAAINLPLRPTSPRTGGLDVADGGDNETVLITRHGGLVTRVQAWKRLDTRDATLHSMRMGHADAIDLLSYDRIGVGAGVHSTLKGINGQLRFKHNGVNVGKPATARKYSDDPNPASERFANLKAELWWSLRLRFQRTYNHVHGHEEHPHEDLIAIPNDAKLVSQLSIPKIEFTGTGKVKVESKESLARRGIPSPDHADALVLAFCDKGGFGWL